MQPKDLRRGRFNVIDLLILLTFLALIVAAVLRTGDDQSVIEPAALSNTEIRFLIEELPDHQVSGLTDGDMFYVSDSSSVLGTLKSAEFQRAQVLSYGPDGTPILVEYDNAYDVRCVVSTEGSFTDHGFLLGGEQYLAPGMTLTVKTATITTRILITDIKAVV